MKKQDTEKNRGKKIKVFTIEDVFGKKNTEFKRGYDEESLHLSLARELKAVRIKRSMTQMAVAKKAAMPQSVIARIESGERNMSVETLHRVATALGKRIILA